MALPFEQNLFHVKQDFFKFRKLLRGRKCNCRRTDIFLVVDNDIFVQLSTCRHFVPVDHARHLVHLSTRRHFVQLAARPHAPFERRGRPGPPSWVPSVFVPRCYSPALVASVSMMAIFCMSSSASP